MIERIVTEGITYLVRGTMIYFMWDYWLTHIAPLPGISYTAALLLTAMFTSTRNS